MLLNQKVSISQKELDKLLNLPSVKFYLPFTDETHPALLGIIRKPHTKLVIQVSIFLLINLQVINT